MYIEVFLTMAVKCPVTMTPESLSYDKMQSTIFSEHCFDLPLRARTHTHATEPETIVYVGLVLTHR